MKEEIAARGVDQHVEVEVEDLEAEEAEDQGAWRRRLSLLDRPRLPAAPSAAAG